MRGLLLLGLAVVVLLTPGAVATEEGSSPDEAAVSCVFTNGYVVSVNHATCVRAAMATADWVQSQVGPADNA